EGAAAIEAGQGGQGFLLQPPGARLALPEAGVGAEAVGVEHGPVAQDTYRLRMRGSHRETEPGLLGVVPRRYLAPRVFEVLVDLRAAPAGFGERGGHGPADVQITHERCLLGFRGRSRP